MDDLPPAAARGDHLGTCAGVTLPGAVITFATVGPGAVNAWIGKAV